jgi:hypothetical protein
MVSHLEENLQDALISRAEEVPERAVDRLIGIDYQRRAQPTSRRLVLSGAALIVIAVAATLVVSIAGPARQTAFASWAARPSTPAPGQVHKAEVMCHAAIMASVALTQAVQPGAPLSHDENLWHPVIADTRGAFTLIAFAAKTTKISDDAACLTGGRSFAGGPQLVLVANPASTRTPSGAISYAAGSGGQYTIAVGTISSGVTGVTLVFNNGTHVTASVEGRLYAAWWPGRAQPQFETVTTANGRHTQSLEVRGGLPRVRSITPSSVALGTGSSAFGQST